MPTIRVLSARQVREAVSMREAIDAMRSAFSQLAAGQADMPDGMSPREVIAASDDVVGLVRGMTEDDLRRDALNMVRDLWPDDWPNVWHCSRPIPVCFTSRLSLFRTTFSMGISPLLWSRLFKVAL